jgi:hypothetical protein
VTEQTNRPQQITTTCYFLMAASAFVVLGSFLRVNSLNTLAVQDGIRDNLKLPPMSAFDLSLSQGTQVLFWANVITALSAAVIGILAYWMLQRQESARLGASIAAVTLGGAGLMAESLTAMMTVGLVVLMWLQPAKAWFAGMPIPVAYRRPEPGSGAPATSGFGQLPATATEASVPAGQPVSPPPALTRAAILGGGFSALTGLGALTNVVFLLVTPGPMLDQVRGSLPSGTNLTDQQLVNTALGGAVVVSVWSVIAVAFAIAAWRGRAWGRSGLLVSSIVAGGVCLVASLSGAAIALLPLFACTLCARALTRPEVRQYVAKRQDSSQ